MNKRKNKENKFEKTYKNNLLILNIFSFFLLFLISIFFSLFFFIFFKNQTFKWLSKKYIYIYIWERYYIKKLFTNQL